MGFWLARGIVGLVAVFALLVPAATAAVFGFSVLQAEIVNSDRREEAHQELMLYHAEIILAENRVRQKPESLQNFHEANVANALLEWAAASDDWRGSDYAQMAGHVVAGRQILVDSQLIHASETDLQENGWRDGETTASSFRWGIALLGLVVASIMWTIWAGMSRAARPAVPVPVFPGEVDLPRREPAERAPSTALPDLAGASKRSEKTDPSGRARTQGTRTTVRVNRGRPPASMEGRPTKAAGRDGKASAAKGGDDEDDGPVTPT